MSALDYTLTPIEVALLREVVAMHDALIQKGAIEFYNHDLYWPILNDLDWLVHRLNRVRMSRVRAGLEGGSPDELASFTSNATETTR
jgi:hypothetical protein